MRPERNRNLVDYNIVVEDVSGGDIANIIRGHVIVKEERVPFSAIAYGRYGGQNIAPKLSPAAKRKLKGLFSDMAAFEEDLQLRLVAGDFDMKPGQGHEHGHQHTREGRERT